MYPRGTSSAHSAPADVGFAFWPGRIFCLTLDEGENRVDSYCRYLIAAFETVLEGTSDETQALLESGGTPVATFAAGSPDH